MLQLRNKYDDDDDESGGDAEVRGRGSNGMVRGYIELCLENERWIITEETEEVRSRLAAAALFVSTAHSRGKAHASAQ